MEQVLEPPPALEAEQAWIEAGIAELGGMVVPRLSWATPHDAAWINGGEVQCGSVGEVLTVLKASDDVTEAIETGWPSPDGCSSGLATAAATSREAASAPEPAPVPAEANRELLLVCHEDLAADPGHCFRVFAHEGRATGVSQRVPHIQFPAAVRRADEAAAAAAKLVEKLIATPVPLPDGSSHILHTFAADFSLTPKGAARLLDLQPWDGELDTLLFSRPELARLAGVGGTPAGAGDDDMPALEAADGATDMPALEAVDGAIGDAGTAVMSTPGTAAGLPEVRVRLGDGKLSERAGRSMEQVPMPAELAMLLGQSAAGPTDESLVASLNEMLHMAQGHRPAAK